MDGRNTCERDDSSFDQRGVRSQDQTNHMLRHGDLFSIWKSRWYSPCSRLCRKLDALPQQTKKPKHVSLHTVFMSATWH